MAIKGDLSSMDLAQVLQMLSLHQKEGELVIDLGNNRKRSMLCCRHGITALPICDLNDESTLHHVIKRRNIAGGSLIGARKKYERQNKPLIDALKEVGLIERSWLLPMLRERIQSQILDLFFLTSGKFAFYEEPAQKFVIGLDAEEREALFFSVEEIIMEGSKRLDEWDAIRDVIPTTEEIFQAIRMPETVGEDGMATEVMELLMTLNGVRDLNEVAEITQLGIFRVCGYAAELLREGYIAPVEPHVLLQTAHTLFQNGRMEEALRVFHRVLELTGGDPDVRLKIALIHERQGEYLRASEHYRILAELHLRDGAIAQCFGYYLTVLRILPTDLDVLGRLIGLYLRYASRVQLDTFDIIEGARILVQVYVEMFEVDKAIDLLQRLVKAEIDIHQSRNQLIHLYIKHGRTDEAVSELEKIGNRMLNEGNRAGALRIYQQILKLSPGRRDIGRILDDVDDGRRMTRQRRRRRRGMVRSGVYLCVFIAGYLYYGNVAALELKAISVQDYIDDKQFVPAKRRVQEFIDRYPFSTAAAEARSLLISIESQYAQHRSQQTRRIDNQADIDRQNLKKAVMLYDEARSALSLNQLERGLQLLRQASHLSAANPGWRKEVGLDRNLQQIHEYLDGASKLRQEAEQALEAGKHRESYQLFLRLYRECGYAKVARGLQVPVLLESEPPGASIWLGRRRLDGVTPLVARLPLAGRTVVTFRKDGFDAVEVGIRPERRSSLRAVLPRLPAFVVDVEQIINSTSMIHGDLLVVGCLGGRVVAVDLDREKLRWVKRFAGLNDHASSPAIDAEGVFTGSVDPGLFRLDSSDGQQMWHLNTRTYFAAAPLLVSKYVVAADSKGTVWCAWADKGNEAWHVDTGARVASRPAYADGEVFVGNLNGDLLVLGVNDGKVIERVKLKGGIHVSPLVADRLIVVMTDAGMLYAIDRDGFKTKSTWLVDGSVVAPLRLDGEWVYVTIAKGELLRFNLRTGKQEEKSFRADSRFLSGPVVRRDGVYLGGMNGVLYVLDRSDLKLRWSLNLASAIRGSIVEWDDIVIVTTQNGRVYGFPPDSTPVRGNEGLQGARERHR